MTKKKINLIAKDLFNNVRQEDVLQFIGGKLFHGGKIVSPDQQKMLSEDAAAIIKMPVWRLLVDEMRYLGNKKIYEDSTSDIDILAGKMVLWTMDVFQKKLSNLSRLSTRRP